VLNRDTNTAFVEFANTTKDSVESVTIKFKDQNIGLQTLTLDTDASVPTTLKILDQETIGYLEFTYSGDQGKFESVEIKFTLPKAKVTDPKAIKLGRYANNEWTYYVPSNIEDKGTYYLFTVEVPGFSYYAVVNFKEIIENEEDLINSDMDKNEILKITVDSNVNKDNNYLEEDYNNIIISKTDKESNRNSLYWIIGIILILGIIFGLYLYLKNKPKNPGFSFNSNNVKQDIQKPSL